jgi:hypothetical protein
VTFAIIIIIVVNLIYYKETIFSFLKWLYKFNLCQKIYSKLLKKKKLNIS